MIHKQILLLFILLQAAVAFGENSAEPQSGFINANPADHLPPYIKLASGFGERPDWSHDGRFMLFVEKPMGEVYELELATGIIRPKTRHFNHYGFTRALYLANGDILLSDPNANFDPTDHKARARARDLCWLSVLDKSGKSKPVPLNTLCAEGPAVSRSKMTIAWTQRDLQVPDLGKHRAKLLMAEIIYEGGIPKLSNERTIFDSKQLPFPVGADTLEAKTFVPPDDVNLTFTVYGVNKSKNTDVYVLNTKSGEFKALTSSPHHYDEASGAFPDGLYTCVKHAPIKNSAYPLIDLFKVKLDGSGEMQRLTYFSDYKGYKASNGVVSDDGKYLCFQLGKDG
jgi:hypothetical protein